MKNVFQKKHQMNSKNFSIQRIVFICFSFAVVILFSSCVDEIDLKLDNDAFTKLIVDGIITDDSYTQTILLKLTSPYDSDAPCPAATGAIVSVNDGYTTFLFTETSPGIYQNYDMKGEVSRTYSLIVEFEGKKYEATSIMSEGFPLDSIQLKDFPHGWPADKPHAEILVWGQEPLATNQFFIFQYAINGEWKDTLMQQGFFADFLGNGKYFDGVRIGIFDTYEDTVRVQVRTFSVDEQYFQFIDACIWNIMPNMFFSPPPANVKGNISNGALGYFRASSVRYSPEISAEMRSLKK
jgi:hypothetical protein